MTQNHGSVLLLNRAYQPCDHSLLNPEKYFLDGRFQAHILADDLGAAKGIITLTETNEIYGWQEGYYVGGSDGENLLRMHAATVLQDKLGKVSRHQVNELLNQVRMRSYQPYDVFENSLNRLPVRNGVLNLESLDIEPYELGRHYFLFQLPVSYDPEADCPSFKEFVSQIVYSADVPLVQEICGYCLWGDGIAVLKKAVMLLGDGDNGKSLFTSILVSLLGRDNVESISLSNLAENRFASAYLRGKLANIHPDVPDRALRETEQIKPNSCALIM